MNIEIQNKKNEALFKNGKYQFTFIPKLPTEKIKIHHMGCVGDTRLNHIQLEQGTEVTSFVTPDKKVNSLSGIFKQLRDLDIQMRDQNSELWGKIKLNNAGAILDFYDKNIKTEISTLAGKVNLAISELDNKVLKKSDVTVTSNGITIGSGKTIDGRTIASIMKVQPDSIDLISPLIRVTGNMVVDGTLEGRKIKANTLETGHHKAGSITTEILAANAVKAINLNVDNALIKKFLANSAFITELFAKKAFINQLQTVKITSTQIDTEALKGKTIIGGTMEGGIIKGNIKIRIGEYGFLAPINFGLHINAPKSYGANSGVGMQLHGYRQWIDDDTSIPKGLFIYDDDDFSVRGTKNSINETLLTVGGMIKARTFTDGQGNYDEGYVVVTSTRNRDNEYPIRAMWSTNDGLAYNTSGATVYIDKTANSDKRLKYNIKPTKEKVLSKLERFDFKEFNWLETGKFESLGVIAQELYDIDSTLVDKKEKSQFLYLNEKKLLMYSLKAAQELLEAVKILEKEIEEIKYAR